MAPEQNFRALCEVTPRSAWGTLVCPVQSTFCRKLPQSCSHGYKATSQQPMCLLFKYLHTCVSGPMLYDKHEDVYIFSVAGMRKWALKDRQNPHAARLGSPLPGVVPSPHAGFFLCVGLVVHPYACSFRSAITQHPCPIPPSPRESLAGGTGYRQMGKSGSSSDVPEPFCLFWCPPLQVRTSARSHQHLQVRRQSIQFQSWPVEFRLSASPRVAWKVTNSVNGPGWIAHQ